MLCEAFCFVLPSLQERGIAISVSLPARQVCSGSHFHVVPKSKVQDDVSPKACKIL